MDITLIWYLVPAIVMFCCGVYGGLPLCRGHGP